MNDWENRYTRFAIVREMLETAEVIKNLDLDRISDISKLIKGSSYLFSGEGSSRIFPSRKIMYDALCSGYIGSFHTEGATQAAEYDLKKFDLLVASNSGKTRETLKLIRHARKHGSGLIISAVATGGTPIALEADYSYILSCGKEDAVAATKSVIEQALFYDLIFRMKNSRPLPDLEKLSRLFLNALTASLPAKIIKPLESASMLYWAGKIRSCRGADTQGE